MRIENENTFKSALRQGVSLFFGSGFSILAQDGNGRPLPTGETLASELARRFPRHYDRQPDLEQLVTIIEHSQKSALTEYLKQRFAVATYDERYHIIPCMNIKTIFTTNVDDLLHRIYGESTTHYLNDVYVEGPAYNDRAAVDVVSLHGSIMDDARELKFGALALAAAFDSDPGHWGHLSVVLGRFPTIFWGYSVQDPATRTALSLLPRDGEGGKDRWVIVPKPESGAADYFYALGFQVIVADTSEMLDYLVATDSLTEEVTLRTPDRTTKSVFPQEAIPTLSDVTLRPIFQFFLGAPPQWCDIYSPVLYKTAHFNGVRDSINSGSNTAIIGVPACGKTTLMMQVAAQVPFRGHKLILDSLTLEKAKLCLKRLQGDRALVFVDNFTDSVQGVRYLADSANVHVVGADRDYNFEIVRHLLDLDQWKVFDVTELSESDIQACLQSIPHQIRTDVLNVGRTTRPKEGTLTQPSLFELIEWNLRGPRLKARFASVLTELGQDAPVLRDVLVMMCYVRACRTPISMDMMMAFLRQVTKDYRKVYKLVDKLGGMVSEYFGEFVESSQDYWVPRSTMVGEAVLASCDGPTLKKMLTIFHNNITPLSICRYDVFRRQGYDNELALNAFPHWREGLDFYEKLYRRDRSPYLLQQQALYLSKKHRYDEAFVAIDRALVASGRNIWSIRNSHAIILFKANITRPADSDTEKSLKQSMDILTECYESDRRKPYHACTFAEQALEYRQVYGDEDAFDYLNRALSWLENERERSPWNRKVKRLLPEVRRALAE